MNNIHLLKYAEFFKFLVLDRKYCPVVLHTAPPESYKYQLIKSLGELYNRSILVETGTYKGDMLFFNKDNFSKIYSIELDDKLFSNAVKRFKNHEHIKLYHGDSGVKITTVLNILKEPAIFWLDAHYNRGWKRAAIDTPIVQELKNILKHNIKKSYNTHR